MDGYVSPKIAKNIVRYEKRQFYNLLQPTKKRPPVIPSEAVDIPGSPVQYRILLSHIYIFLRADIERNQKKLAKLSKKVTEQKHKFEELGRKLGVRNA